MTTSNFRKDPSVVKKIEAARHVAERLHARLARESIPVRSAFVVSSESDVPPPLTQLLRGGRGGEVKVKLLLSMIWVAAAEPFDVTLPARAWAELLGLDDPGTKGAARVNAAIRKLIEMKYLGADKRPGQPSRIILRSELGDGDLYSHPGAAWDAAKDAAPRVRRNIPRYMRIPSALWTSGWVALLSGPGMAMLLILLESARGRNPEDLWFAPSVAAARYSLNEATRKKGLDELESFGLITVGRALVVRDVLSTKRMRNTYTVQMEELMINPDD